MFSSLLSFAKLSNNENCFLRTTLPNPFDAPVNESFLVSIVESLQFILSLTNSSSDECGRAVEGEENSLPLPAYISERKFRGLRRGMKRANRVLWHNGQYDWKIFRYEENTIFETTRKTSSQAKKDDDKVEPKSQHCRVVINSLLRQFNENFEIEDDPDSCHSRSRQNNDFE